MASLSPRATLLKSLLRLSGDDGIGGECRVLPVTAALRDLTGEPVYAIPDVLLNALKRHVLGWLEDDEFEQEARFSQLCRGLHAVAVFLGQPARHTFFSPQLAPKIDDVLFGELGWTQCGTRESVEQSIRWAQGVAAPLLERLEAYLGWLMTCPAFLAERDALRDKWAGTVQELGGIPQYPVRLSFQLGRPPAAAIDSTGDDLVADFTAFYG
jgi:hypothetical protein